MLLERPAQLGDNDAFLRTGLDLDRQHAQAVDEFQHAVIGRRLDRDDVSGVSNALQREQQRFLPAVCDHHLLGLDLHTRGVEVVVGDLAAQCRLTQRRRVAETAFFRTRHHALHGTMQGLGGRLRHTGVGDAQRNEVWVVDAVVHTLHERPASQADGGALG